MQGLKIFLSFILVLPNIATAETRLLLRAESASAINFQAHIEAEAATQAYSGWWIRQRVPTEARLKLKNLLTQAQNEFLRGGIESAEIKFNEITALAHEQDWRSVERATLVYAHLRSAQLATDEDTKLEQLKQAARFGDVELQENLFPPPVWQEYLRLKKLRYSESLDLDLWFPEARYLLIDGRPIEIFAGVQIELDEQTHRFSLVYDHAPPVSRKGTWNELKAWQPQPKAFALGTCEQPEIDRGAVPTNAAVYFNENCIFNLNSPQTAVPAKISYRPDNPATSFPAPLSAASKTKVSRWVWAVAGAVVVAAVAMNQENKKESQPTTTIGF